MKYIDKLTQDMKDVGNLEGIVLTGLTKDGVDLMESYVDRTGDVQTASYCMLQVSHSEIGCSGYSPRSVRLIREPVAIGIMSGD